MRNCSEVENYMEQCVPERLVKALDGRYARRLTGTQSINSRLRERWVDTKLDRIGGLSAINFVMMILIIIGITVPKIIRAVAWVASHSKNEV